MNLFSRLFSHVRQARRDRQARPPVHKVEIALIQNESIVNLSNEGDGTLDDIKTFIVQNSNKISFIRHTIVYSEEKSNSYTLGLCTIDFETGKMKASRNELLKQSEINKILDKLV